MLPFADAGGNTDDDEGEDSSDSEKQADVGRDQHGKKRKVVVLRGRPPSRDAAKQLADRCAWLSCCACGPSQVWLCSSVHM